MFGSSRLTRIVLSRCYSNGGGSSGSGGVKSSAPSSSAGNIPNVTGLSSNCVKPFPGTSVGPGAAPDSEYKVPEYFLFNRFSYAEAEIEMAKYRCPQPSALKK